MVVNSGGSTRTFRDLGRRNATPNQEEFDLILKKGQKSRNLRK
jgi:hypothetical protein